MSKPNHFPATIIPHHFAHCVATVKAERLIFSYKDNIEEAVMKHAVKLTLALTYCDGAIGVVVVNIDSSKLALLIVVVGILIFIKLEVAILAGIDIEVYQLRLFLIAPLQRRTERDY